MLMQLLMAMLAVMAFAVLFGAPTRHLIASGLTGVVAWGVYAGLRESGMTDPLCMVIAATCLTIVARGFAVAFQAPTTIFLVCGIFPLVPGAGVYYSAYYLIMDSFELAAQHGSATLKSALAIAIGIVLGSSVPQKWFGAVASHLRRRSREKRRSMRNRME